MLSPQTVRPLQNAKAGRASVQIVALVSRVAERLPVQGLSSAPPQLMVVSLLAILIDYCLVPRLNTVAPAFATGLLFVMLLRRQPPAVADATDSLLRIKKPRLIGFVLVHSLIVSACWLLQGQFPAAISKTPSGGLFLAAAKYGILAPSLILLPRAGWKRVDQLYRAEWVAAAIALTTLFPYRLFVLVWPWYSQRLSQAAYVIARPFVPGLQLVSGATPVIHGPDLDLAIIFACSGLSAIKLFQMVFAIMLVLDWRALDRFRTCIGYFTGLGIMLCANAARIAVLVIIGNAGYWDLALRYHITAGWIYFGVVTAGWFLGTYWWLRGCSPINRSVLSTVPGAGA